MQSRRVKLDLGEQDWVGRRWRVDSGWSQGQRAMGWAMGCRLQDLLLGGCCRIGVGHVHWLSGGGQNGVAISMAVVQCGQLVPLPARWLGQRGYSR
jgi:hypothetical protein